MTELVHNINYEVDLAANTAAAQEQAASWITEPNDNTTDFVAGLPITHATGTESVRDILRSGAILPHRIITGGKTPTHEKRMRYNTDIFDIELGLDRFSFWSLRRSLVNPGLYPVIFYGDQNTANEGLVAPEDIADLGALVSPEARLQIQIGLGLSAKQIDKRTELAKDKFFRSILPFDTYSPVLARYIDHIGGPEEYLAHHEYALHKPLADEDLQFYSADNPSQIGHMQAWPGPQVMLGSISLSELKGALILNFGNSNPAHKTAARLIKKHTDLEVHFVLDHLEDLIRNTPFILDQAKKQQANPIANFHIITNALIHQLSAM